MIAIITRLKEFGLYVDHAENKDTKVTFPFTGVTSNTNEMKDGMIFVATRGTKIDAHQFLESLGTSDTRILVGELPPKSVQHGSAHYIQVSDSQAALAQLSALFYQDPSRSLFVIGITGTSGKTTTSYVIESILKACGYRVGVIGTIEYRFEDQVFESTHTTPGPVELQALISKMKNQGCNALVMEVSSHALKQRRVDGIAFDGAIYLNLSQEHLDYHPDMDDYFNSKKLFFSRIKNLSEKQGKKFHSVANADDSYGKKLLAEFSDVQAFHQPNWASTPEGISGTIEGKSFQCRLFGPFNIENISASVAISQALHLPIDGIIQGLNQIKSVPGRLEKIPNSRGVHVFVDYAHKPDALQKVLGMFRSQIMPDSATELVVVFGCGGDRDKTKRPVMGKIASDLADRIILTSDNPRTEDPDQIIRDVISGISPESDLTIQADRARAIRSAIESAHPGDFVIIAGKGHETYQIIGTEKFPFDDRLIARNC